MTGDAETRSPAAASAPSPTIRLREAASTIFALVTLVPFLVLLFLLHRYEPLAHTESQIGLLLALLLAILGLVVLQRLFGQFARLATAVTSAGDPGTAVVEPQLGAVNGVGNVAEIGQIGSAFARMLDDLKGSTVRLEDLVFKLGALNEVVELAARLSNIDDLLSLVLERCIRTVRATAGAILLLDADRRQLSVAAARGLPDPALPAAALAPGDGVIGRVVQRGEPLVVDDMTGDPWSAGAGGGAYVGVPLGVEGRIIGAVALVRRGKGAAEFTPTDIQFLTTLMAHVGYSLENARLLAETRETAARLGAAVRDLQAGRHARAAPERRVRRREALHDRGAPRFDRARSAARAEPRALTRAHRRRQPGLALLARASGGVFRLGPPSARDGGAMPVDVSMAG